MRTRLDLAYGNPSFIQEISGEYRSVPFKHSMMPYKLGKSTLPELEHAILSVHKKYKNAKITKKSHIIVTTGAVQALSAAMYYYNHKKFRSYLYMPTPYWGRFLDLARATSFRIRTGEMENSFVKLITSPNNPDGADTSHLKADIRDACYNWPHYTDKVKAFSDEIVIFSLSKATGHSSTRIGWAVVNSDEAAAAIQEYVELFTSGVSVEAQTHAAMVLSELGSKDGDKIINTAKKELKKRNKELKRIVAEYGLPIKILSKQGMFWYISCRPQVIFDLNIKCFEGSNFGDHSFDSCKKYRLNIGTSSSDFVDFTQRLKMLGNTRSIKKMKLVKNTDS